MEARYDNLGSEIATAFGLGKLVGEPRLYQHTSFPTWRVETELGSFLAKQLWRGDDPPWKPSFEAMMAFERRVQTSGIRTAPPMEPRTPAFGFAARISGAGVFRVYEWLPHRGVTTSDDLTEWLAQTLVTLHTIEPPPVPFGTARDWYGIFPRQTWQNWLERGETKQASWVPVVRENLDALLGISDRIALAWLKADDAVVTHGDLEPHNVLMTADGPALIDWESVGYESKTLEVGRTAIAFMFGEPARARRLIDMYRTAGGHLAELGRDLYLRPAALTLGHITERIMASVGEGDVVGWMNGATLDEDIVKGVHKLRERVALLTALAEER